MRVVASSHRPRNAKFCDNFNNHQVAKIKDWTMLKNKIIVSLAAGMLFSLQAVAGDGAALEAAPEPPPLPQRVQSGEVMEPEVIIIQRKEETIHEYRVNGRLRAVKVVPKNAPIYYLVDADGDGELETRQSELSPDFLINKWVLFRW